MAPSFVHQPRRHAARRTREYLYSQLIPYLGNKRKLLPLIHRAMAETGCRGGCFVDLFTGSTAVARLAKTLGFRVLANDWEPYAFELASGAVVPNRTPRFPGLGGARRVFRLLNALPPVHGYVARHLCPRDDEQADPERERMFFTRENGERIDAAREAIACWEAEGLLPPLERSYLLSALLYALSYVSNTSGVFKGFHHGWGGKTRTALYRIRSRLLLEPPLLCDNGEENLAFQEDAHILAPRLGEIAGARPEIVYLDPPYNQHPYGSNYHVLNTVALWDKPPVGRSIVARGRGRNKSAIRTDWRTSRRSPYNSAKTALPAFESLLDRLDARWILLSYSTDGNMPLDGLFHALARRGALSLHRRRYKRYRVSTPRMSRKSHNIEFVAVLDTSKRPSKTQAEKLAEEIRAEEKAAPEPA
ncbi:MAG: DNA adenine methylase [Planctomycetota bacterium]